MNEPRLHVFIFPIKDAKKKASRKKYLGFSEENLKINGDKENQQWLQNRRPYRLYLQKRFKQNKGLFELSTTPADFQKNWVPKWRTTVLALKELFIKEGPELFTNETNDFTIGKWRRDEAHASWEHDIIEKYRNWYYIEFRTHYWFSQYSKSLQEKLSQNHIVDCQDWGWDGTKMFFKRCTPKTLRRCLVWHKKLTAIGRNLREFSDRQLTHLVHTYRYDWHFLSKKEKA